MRPLKKSLQKIPLLREIAAYAKGLWIKLTFKNAEHYWQQRYEKGGTSGAGSRGALAQYKSDFINRFIKTNNTKTHIEFGCGDGYQLGLIHYENYIGLDISQKSIALCQAAFKKDITKSFFLYHPQAFYDKQARLSADLALSLDVIYHITDDHDYTKYLQDLFNAAQRYVILYTSDTEQAESFAHIKHRKISTDIQTRFPNWTLLLREENPHTFQQWNDDTSRAHFFIYQKNSTL